MIDVAVIDNPAAAEAALEPARARLLAQLTEPRSAAMLAAAIGLPRQKVKLTCGRWSGTGWWNWWRSGARAT